MPRSRLLAVVVLLLACCLAGTVPAAQAEDAPNTWAGVWDTKYGRMTLDAGGSGKYEWTNPGTITGRITDRNVLEGTWVQPGNQASGTLTFTMSVGGRAFSGEWFYDNGQCVSDCGWHGTCIEGACLSNRAPSSSPSPPAELIATVSSVSGEAAYRLGAGEWQPLKAGDRLPLRGEVFTGVDSTLTLTFLDGGSFAVGELTQILVDTLTTAENRKTVALQLKLGAIKATVPKEQVLDTNFEIQTPICAASSRGTVFSVSHDEKAGVTLVSVEESSVSVDPVDPDLATTIVDAGKEVAVSRDAITDPVEPGTAVRQLGGSKSKPADDDGISPGVVALALLLAVGIGAGLFMTRRRAAPPGRPTARPPGAD